MLPGPLSARRFFLFLLTALWLSAAPPAFAADPQPGEELSRLAQELRKDASPRNYQRLERFAERYAEGELSGQAHFALGLADFEAKRWGRARDHFAVAARSSHTLSDYATLYLARTQIEQGALEDARQTLDSVSFGSSLLAEPALALESELLAKLGRPAEGVELLERAPGLRERPALLFALGQAQRAAGNTPAAIETLQQVYYQFPLSAQAEPANALLSQWRQQMKTGFPQPSEALRRTRGDLLWAQKAYRGARSAYLDLAMHAAEPTRREAMIRAALGLYLTGGQRGACEEIAGLDGLGSKAEAEWRGLRSRCAVLNDDTQAAEAEFTALAASFPASEWYEAALLAAGDTALVRGNRVLAQQYYQRLIAAFPQSSSAAEAHWKLAWQSYRSRSPEAARLMQEHLERFPDSPFLPRALYWRARLAVAAKDDALAERLLALLREYAPRDYTAQQGEILAAQIGNGPAGDEERLPAWVASLRLRAQPPAAEPLAPVFASQIQKAAALSRLGLYDLADEGLDAALDRQPHPALYLAQARVAFAQQKFALATVLLARAYPGYWRYRLEDLPREAWEIMYPKLYWEIIQREGRKHNLDPYLVAGLIRQESRFESEAVSSVGAVGLMQLMPGTARRLAGHRVSRGGLYDPETNIRLGTKYLADLLAQFGGSVEKAVAGYNAGGGRVTEWSSESYADPAEFVESISITQTREFVHTVLRNHRFYRDLYPPQ